MFRVDAALTLAEDSKRFDQAKNRFNDSSPRYRSQIPGNKGRYKSSNPLDEEQQRWDKRKRQLTREYDASRPYKQFEQQQLAEYHRLFKPSPGTFIISDQHLADLVNEIVKNRWIEQGIWKNEWENKLFMWRWKHEEPFKPESESESERRFQFDIERTKQRRPKSDEEFQLMAERRSVREREHEASRPFHQFIYQVSKERERIERESGPDGLLSLNLTDINTKAYENVKNSWMKPGIWNRKWGILPGMSWKHEQPLEEMLAAEIGPAPLSRDREATTTECEGIYAPIQLFGPPSPVNLNNSSGPGHTNASQKMPTALDLATPQKGNENESLIASNKLWHLPDSGQDGRSAEQQQQPFVISDTPVSATVLPRRSKRSRETKSQPSADNISNYVTGARPKRTTTSRLESLDSVKPKGVSKRRLPRISK